MIGQDIWSFQTDGRVWSSPVLAYGSVFVASDDEHVYALSAANGDVRWSFSSSGTKWYAPVVAGGVVVVVSEDGQMLALSAEDGHEIWSQRVADDLSLDPPAVANGTVFVCSYDGHLFAISARNGERLWTFEGQGASFFSLPAGPAVEGGIVYWPGGSSIHALAADSGRLHWSFSCEGFASQPVVSDGVVCFGTSSLLAGMPGMVYAISEATGEELWSFGTEREVNSRPAAADGVVYATTSGGITHALSTVDGHEIWRFVDSNVALSTYGSPAVEEGIVYVGSESDWLHVLASKEGVVLWAYETGGKIEAAPAVKDAVAFVGSGDGKVYAVSGVGNEDIAIGGTSAPRFADVELGTT